MDFPSLFIAIAHAAEEEAANQSVAGMFGLNAKLFIAQLVNFGIVMFVLWKWVFKPVSKGLAERSSKIDKSLKDAEAITLERNEFDVKKQSELTAARHEAATIITQARQEAAQVREQLLGETKQEQQRLVEQTKLKLAEEQKVMVSGAREQVADLVINATEKILQAKLDERKDRELIKKALAEAEQR
jgi:F-type H+-transporting ATPase subunit b